MKPLLVLCVAFSTMRGLWYLLLLSNSVLAIERRYYIAAQNVLWDYAPNVKTTMDGLPIPYKKTTFSRTLYKGYADETFSTVVNQPETNGDLGPVIRLEVGDVAIVTFFNNGSEPFTMHPHGLIYTQQNEGISIQPVQPGETTVYTWVL